MKQLWQWFLLLPRSCWINCQWCLCLCLWLFVTLCWTREDDQQNLWFVIVCDGFSNFCVICDEISDIFCESQTQIKIWYCPIDSFFRTNYQCSRKRTGHCSWPHCSFSGSDLACNHPSCCRTCCFSRPCHCVEGNRGIYCLDDNSRIMDHHGWVGCFNGSCDIYNCNVDGSLIQSYMR